jgi:hypothetical protein
VAKIHIIHMESKKQHLSPLIILTLTFLLETTTINLLPLPCWAANKELKTGTFSLHVKDKPLREVLDKISMRTGYGFTVDERWQSLPVTAQLEDVTVEEGLKRLLKGLNHSLVIEDAEKKISIKILNRSHNIQASEQAALPNFPQTQLDPGDIEVAPPEKPGEKGLTLRELDAIIAKQKEIDPGDIEVIPPEKPGEKGITQRELDAIIAKQKKIDPGDIEVAPPENPGERGLTQRELDAIIAAQKDKTPDIEVHPASGLD